MNQEVWCHYRQLPAAQQTWANHQAPQENLLALLVRMKTKTQTHLKGDDEVFDVIPIPWLRDGVYCGVPMAASQHWPLVCGSSTFLNISNMSKPTLTVLVMEAKNITQQHTQFFTWHSMTTMDVLVLAKARHQPCFTQNVAHIICGS